MKNLRKNIGVTLVELLTVVFLLSIGICGTLLLFVNSMLSSELAWDMTVATSHAENVLEQMQSLPELTDISNTNWTDWALLQELNTLPGESVYVSLGDPSQNPLDIQVMVRWKRKERENEVVLKTKLTK